MNMKTKTDIEALAKDMYPDESMEIKTKGGSYMINNDPTRDRSCFIAGYTSCQDEDRWVLVSERLPASNGYYSCYFESNNSVMPRWYFKGQWMHPDSNTIADNKKKPVTAWQPLPNPPKK